MTKIATFSIIFLAYLFNVEYKIMRKRREKEPQAIFHVTAKINRQELALENQHFKQLFIDVVKQAKQKYQFQLRNFCIMGNHVHLDIQPMENEDISRIMQWILSIFARRFNKIFHFKGHVWYDRFKSKIIRTVRQYINTFLYIANNPVRAGLVTHPLLFAYNGVSFLLNDQQAYGLLHPPEPKLECFLKTYLERYSENIGKRKRSDCSFQVVRK